MRRESAVFRRSHGVCLSCSVPDEMCDHICCRNAVAGGPGVSVFLLRSCSLLMSGVSAWVSVSLSWRGAVMEVWNSGDAIELKHAMVSPEIPGE